jgi:hypothetical protein
VPALGLGTEEDALHYDNPQISMDLHLTLATGPSLYDMAVEPRLVPPIQRRKRRILQLSSRNFSLGSRFSPLNSRVE